MEKLFSTFGIEFSYLPPKLEVHTRHRNQRGDCHDIEEHLSLAEAFSSILCSEFRVTGSKFCNISVDEGAIEITSPVFKNLPECKKFFLFADKVARKHGLTDHRDDCYSGGGHIHWGLQHMNIKKRVKFLITLYRDITNRPYLNWMFNEYCDVCSAESYLTTEDEGQPEVERVKEVILKDDVAKVAINDWDVLSIAGAKGCSVRYDQYQQTVEFRVFDAKRSWKDVEDHVLFANAYLKYIQKRAQNPRLVKVTVRSEEDVKAKIPTAIKEFKAFVEELGLDWKRYRRFVALNFKAREENGAFIYIDDPIQGGDD